MSDKGQLRKIEKEINVKIPNVDEIYLGSLGVKFDDNEKIIGLSLPNIGIREIPEYIFGLESIVDLLLGNNKIMEIPDQLTNLITLKRLYLNNNELLSLSEKIDKLSNLMELNVSYNNLETIPNSLCNLKSLKYLILDDNKLKNLPDEIGQLKSLVKLNVANNRLEIIPDSLKKLDSLMILDLGGNNLDYIPEFIGNITALRSLNIKKNNLKIIPKFLWKLINLDTLTLSGNPFEGISKDVSKRPLPQIMLFCRNRSPINIYISLSYADHKIYRIEELRKNLENIEGINRAYYSTLDQLEDAASFIEKNIQQCKILIFFATRNSINFEQCLHELSEALKNNLIIIPVKGMWIEWKEIIQINLGSESERGYYSLGRKDVIEFNFENYEKFLDDLNSAIRKEIKRIDIFEREIARIDKLMINIKKVIQEYLQSNEYKEDIKRNLLKLEEIYHDFSVDNLKDLEFIIKCFQALSKKADLLPLI
ncbi:MAG: hypothetical protein EU551_00615 [Promethearchaeota archaeon]|nr:MAG: hypothetical protein EU551_00615 [Candidatus Lokiarchaeota archaeon]